MKFILTIIILFDFIPTRCQVNLVPNPSFEDYWACPEYLSEFYKCDYWFNPTANTPDLFNECSTAPFSAGGADIPKNFPGFQFGRTGFGYAGVAISFSPNEQREYVSIKLTDNLLAEQNYCVELYISLAEYSKYSIDKIGIYFSNDSIYYASNNILNFLPQVYSTTAINDTLNWVKVSGEYSALGGEQFITIGSFFDSLNHQVEVNNWGNQEGSYYYIDDVSVTEGGCPAEEPPVITPDLSLVIPNVFSPNDDEVNDVYEIKYLPQGYSISIYNRWGQELHSFIHEGTEDNNTWYWDGNTTTGIPAPDGVYFYILNIPGEETRRGTVTLLR